MDILVRLGGSHFKWMVRFVLSCHMQLLCCTSYLHIHSYIHKGNQGNCKGSLSLLGSHDSLIVPPFLHPEFRDMIRIENSSKNNSSNSFCHSLVSSSHPATQSVGQTCGL